MKRALAVLLVLALAQASSAELIFKSVSVSDTSTTYTFPRGAEGVTLCNQNTTTAYYRLFWEGETVAAATTSYHVLPAGTSADVPYCVGIPRPQTVPFPWKALTIITASGTTTVTVEII